MKVHVVLHYYNRPLLVKNALRSVRNQTHKDWFLTVLDDGSESPALPAVEEVLGGLEDKWEVRRVEDTPEMKREWGGSLHGKYTNEAIADVQSDVLVVLCDDDALVAEYLEQLTSWYASHPHVNYSFCHVCPYDPTNELPEPQHLTRTWRFNHVHAVPPACYVDASQVTWRTSAFKEAKISYPYPQTLNLDAEVFSQSQAAWGLVEYNGLRGQYKAIFPGQLGTRPDWYDVVVN